MTIKKYLEQLPEPYNWLALEDINKTVLLKTATGYDLRHSVLALQFYFKAYKNSKKADFYEGIYDNLKHLGK